MPPSGGGVPVVSRDGLRLGVDLHALDGRAVVEVEGDPVAHVPEGRGAGDEVAPVERVEPGGVGDGPRAPPERLDASLRGTGGEAVLRQVPLARGVRPHAHVLEGMPCGAGAAAVLGDCYLSHAGCRVGGADEGRLAAPAAVARPVGRGPPVPDALVVVDAAVVVGQAAHARMRCVGVALDGVEAPVVVNPGDDADMVVACAGASRRVVDDEVPDLGEVAREAVVHGARIGMGRIPLEEAPASPEHRDEPLADGSRLVCAPGDEAGAPGRLVSVHEPAAEDAVPVLRLAVPVAPGFLADAEFGERRPRDRGASRALREERERRGAGRERREDGDRGQDGDEHGDEERRRLDGGCGDERCDRARRLG